MTSEKESCPKNLKLAARDTQYQINCIPNCKMKMLWSLEEEVKSITTNDLYSFARHRRQQTHLNRGCRFFRLWHRKWTLNALMSDFSSLFCTRCIRFRKFIRSCSGHVRRHTCEYICSQIKSCWVALNLLTSFDRTKIQIAVVLTEPFAWQVNRCPLSICISLIDIHDVRFSLEFKMRFRSLWELTYLSKHLIDPVICLKHWQLSA